MHQEVLSILLAFIATIAVIILTFYASRWYARRVGTVGGGKHMKLVDRLIVSKSGSILIIDVEGIQYMIGVSDSNVQLLQKMEEPIPFDTQEELKPQAFLKALKTVIHKDKTDEI